MLSYKQDEENIQQKNLKWKDKRDHPGSSFVHITQIYLTKISSFFLLNLLFSKKAYQRHHNKA